MWDDPPPSSVSSMAMSQNPPCIFEMLGSIRSEQVVGMGKPRETLVFDQKGPPQGESLIFARNARVAGTRRGQVGLGGCKTRPVGSNT
jgi:hypothetical protein